MKRRAEYQHSNDDQQDRESNPKIKPGSSRRTRSGFSLTHANEDQASDRGQRGFNDAELESVRTRLDELASLEADWNSYGGSPPAKASIAAAMQFMTLVARVFRQTSSAQVLPTSISPLPSGGIELEWRTSSETVAVDVAPNGRWGYLRKRGSGRQATYEEGTDLSQDQLLPLVGDVIVSRF